jgi:TolB protein
MTPDGSRLVNVSNSWADDVAPVWSPDGRHVAFVSYRDTVAGSWRLGPGSIYVAGFDPVAGTPVGESIRITDPTTNDGWPAWSPDGPRLAFSSKRSGNWDIWAVNLDGSGLANLTDSPGADRHPAWSPALAGADGSGKIAFTSRRGGNRDVWVMNADGSEPENLTNHPAEDQYAMWSPDGEKLTFTTTRDGDYEIYLMDGSGSAQTNLSRSPGSTEGLADWSPDGERLVLYSDRSGNKEIFVVSLSDGQWTNITNHPASDEFCTWSP